MRRSIAAAGLAAGVLAGAVGASLFSPVGFAGAAEDPATEVAESDVSGDGHATWLADTLAPLVDAGTIDQSQADAVIDAIKEARPDRRPGHGPGHLALDAVADLLGISVDELHQALRDGQTLAELGAEQGVEVDAIIGVLVAALDERLAEAVADGRLTQERADEILANATERITNFVNGEGPERGHRGERFRERVQERRAAA